MSTDGFWVEVERIQQREELKDEDGGGGEGRLPEGEALRRGCWEEGRRRARGPHTDRGRTGFLSRWDRCGTPSSRGSLLHPCSLLSVLRAGVTMLFP